MQKKPVIKWKRIVLWCLAIVLVIGVSGVIAVNYAVNRVIDSLANSLETEIPQVTISSNMSMESSKTVSTSIPENNNENPNESSEASLETQGDSATLQAEGEVSNDDPKKEKVGVYSAEVSTDKAKVIKEEITLSEKTSVTSILMGNLSLSDIKLFQEMASGGMTVDEKRAARKVLLDKLSPEEYNKLVAIAKKYGVSRGKTYDEAAKEEAEAGK